MNPEKRSTGPPGTTRLQPNPPPFLRTALIVAVYLLVYILLDLISQRFEEFRGIVAWYPPVGITYTLLLVFGVRFTPAVTIALFLGSVFIYRMPQSPGLLVLWAVIISLIYAGASAFLRKRIRLDLQLSRLRDFHGCICFRLSGRIFRYEFRLEQQYAPQRFAPLHFPVVGWRNGRRPDRYSFFAHPCDAVAWRKEICQGAHGA
jgi:hypothetical protein